MKSILRKSLTMLVLAALTILVGCTTDAADKEDALVIKFADSDKSLTLKQPGKTLSEALEKNGKNVAEFKKLYHPSIPWDASISNTKAVTLSCNCTVKLTVAGKQVGTYKTTKSTVGAFLQEKKVAITAWDELKTSPDSKIVNGMNIVIDKVENKVSKSIQEVPYEKEEKKSNELTKGKKKVEKEGKKGKKIYEVIVTLRNGKPELKDGKPVTTKRLIKEIKPLDELVVIGTKPEETEDDEETSNQESPTGGQTMNVEATGYTHTGNRTATGTVPKRGTIAVDPDVIPLGTRIYVPGYGYGIAEDTGGVVDGKIIDLFFNSQQEAINWGRRNVQIKILN